MAMMKAETKLKKRDDQSPVITIGVRKEVNGNAGTNSKADIISSIPNPTRKIIITKSKTKLIKVDRKFSVKRSVVEKAAEKVFAGLGIEFNNGKGPKLGKNKA